MLYDCICILLISVFGSLVSEGISWFLIYRTDSYKILQSTIEKTQIKIDKMKETVSETDKKLTKLEDQLQSDNQSMSMLKMKSTFAVAIVMITMFGGLNSSYDGYVIAKLPFEPVWFFKSMSHRNLAGTDFTDCGMTFFYVLSSMTIRPNLQKVLGHKPNNSPNDWLKPKI